MREALVTENLCNTLNSTNFHHFGDYKLKLLSILDRGYSSNSNYLFGITGCKSLASSLYIAAAS